MNRESSVSLPRHTWLSSRRSGGRLLGGRRREAACFARAHLVLVPPRRPPVLPATCHPRPRSLILFDGCCSCTILRDWRAGRREPCRKRAIQSETRSTGSWRQSAWFSQDSLLCHSSSQEPTPTTQARARPLASNLLICASSMLAPVRHLQWLKSLPIVSHLVDKAVAPARATSTTILRSA